MNYQHHWYVVYWATFFSQPTNNGNIYLLLIYACLPEYMVAHSIYVYLIMVEVEIGFFTECLVVCRVFFRTLRKELLCRVPKEKHSAQRVLCRVPRKTLGKDILCQVFIFDTRQRTLFADCFFDTRQRSSLPSVKKTLGKKNFKSKFEALNKFKSKSFELQSCITSQDLQYLFLAISSFDNVKINLSINFTSPL